MRPVSVVSPSVSSARRNGRRLRRAEVVCGFSLLREGLRRRRGMPARFTNLVKYAYKLQIVLDKHSKALQCGSGSRVLSSFPDRERYSESFPWPRNQGDLRLLRKVATFRKIAFAA